MTPEQRAKEIVCKFQQLEAEADALRQRVAEYGAAINETLNLADFLNNAASGGAGFSEHWGERVLQAVEPLRNTKEFKDRTLEHNRSLLNYNSELLERIHNLEAQVQRLVSAAEARNEQNVLRGLANNKEWADLEERVDYYSDRLDKADKRIIELEKQAKDPDGYVNWLKSALGEQQRIGQTASVEGRIEGLREALKLMRQANFYGEGIELILAEIAALERGKGE